MDRFFPVVEQVLDAVIDWSYRRIVGGEDPMTGARPASELDAELAGSIRPEGIEGPEIGRLQREGSLDVGDHVVLADELSEVRPGRSFAFVMDTRVCPEAVELARGVDLVVCEATYLEEHAHLAAERGHLTARQAAGIAAEAGARQLVMSHFSERYPHVEPFETEARSVFAASHAAHDLDRFPIRAPS